MSALTFDKSELGNLEYSLQREMLSTDRMGGYMSTTIVCCNTRRYHGLMVAPIDDSDRTYVLLSSLDETVIQHDQTFNLALHRFPGVYEPRGHKYITDFEYTPTPSITYRVGGVILRKEMLWIHKRTQLMIRYTLLDAHSETRLRLRPFLAFRDKHALTHANMEADGHSYPAVNGVKCRLYGSFPWLYLQTSKPGTEFIPAPDWYYNFEYLQDLARGYEGHEDLMTTGYFETELKKGESIIFSASLDEMGSTKTIEEVFAASIARRTHKIDFLSCLEHSARQFVIRRPGNRTEVIAGYPWHGVSGRQAFVSLPGITLQQDHKEDCIDVLDTQVREMQQGMFSGSASAAAAVDAPLWFFWTLQRLGEQIGGKEIWKRYGKAMKELLESYRRGIAGRIALQENGLIRTAAGDMPLTWMNSTIAGRAVTPRDGFQVEVNALWYNAVCYTLELARQEKDKAFVKEWEALPAHIENAFRELFLLPEGYLADYIDEQGAHDDIRPNMILACCLPYKPVDEQTRIDVIRTVRQHLLTPRGLRTLSPRNPLYKGSQEGSPEERDFAAKNGSVWPWLLSFYVKACFDIDGAAYLPTAEEILANFEEEIQSYGIGSIGELYDADPPYAARGAISQAWSVGAILDIYHMIQGYRAAAPKAKATKGGRKTAAAKETAQPKTTASAEKAGQTPAGKSTAKKDAAAPKVQAPRRKSAAAEEKTKKTSKK
ncbi:glycogen debranching enzyme N-terminal domain-containing protein [Alistipes sp.]|uniref:glycogen debranching enzyme N-terminal domain-containing protein n=1 Tax=Alistipes sp. TaxID=1872444 RepID=UPI0025B8415F|nr:glycogen debranching enzyme N-terminal domain-containing protein [Alistipes sp.]MCI7139833.1 glycogen debranching enzyme N-terminal domain-containing protein [Alistipes sp.]MDY5396988.1 amylo-alpha-1,6-glucosidase [Alistipes sp.]